MRLFTTSALVALLAFLGPPVLAQSLEEGLSAVQRGDYATALQHFEPLAEQGDTDAQFNLGLMYDLGSGVTEDDAEAAMWYRRSAEQGHAVAQFNLGVMYDNGEGVAQNALEAVAWYRRAAEQGYSEAQHNLGVIYASGRGVAQDDTCLLYTSPSPRD